MIPVSVITGFLGSGKTTLLASLLRDPAMGRTAVLMNEFGEIALDHDLIETSDESFVQLSTGCLCCNVKSDLVLALGDLAARRAAGTLPRFERVVVETTGLADPAPILQALMSDPGLCSAYVLDNVITTVDAVTGLETLAHHEESLHQAALADTIVITKTDVPEARPGPLTERLAEINPHARVMTAVRGNICASALLATDGRGTARSLRGYALTDAATAAASAHRHREDIGSFSIVREAPLRAATLALFVSALAENCGADLLRMKAIVHVAEQPEAPIVLHGVQHVYHAPVWLPHWPSEDRRTRMVFIGRRAMESWVRALLDLLEAEVAAETTRYVTTA